MVIFICIIYISLSIPIVVRVPSKKSRPNKRAITHVFPGISPWENKTILEELMIVLSLFSTKSKSGNSYKLFLNLPL